MAENEMNAKGTTGETGSNIADEVGLVRPHAAASSDAAAFSAAIPAAPSAPVTLPPAGPDIHTDIEKILREVKIPERRDFKGSAEQNKIVAATNVADTSISNPVTKPPTETEVSRPVSSSIAAMHTLKDDLQHAVKDKKMSLVRAVSLEQDKKARVVADVDFGRIERRKRVARLIFSSIVFLFLGLAALFGVYTVVQSHSAIPTQSPNSLVFAEQSVSLPLESAPMAIKQQVANFRSSPGGSLGSITRIVPTVSFADADGKNTSRPATFAEFIKGIGARAPEELVRALGNDFFFGVHIVDKNAPVIVAIVTSYDHAFAGMLEWESAINSDLAPAFTDVPVTVLDANGIPSARLFKDNVMRNYDVRELKDDLGQVELYYSFPNPNLLIIAESPYSFPEILSRLQSESRL